MTGFIEWARTHSLEMSLIALGVAILAMLK